ncbi:4EB3L protein, partial [Atractosteus spatula]|nr:4EB3L protein [Atractosteus spatula]
MSANCQKSKSCPIPTRVMHLKDCSIFVNCTPVASCVLVTRGSPARSQPGPCALSSGTRIIYDRKFLLDCRNSPVARTPPCFLPQIPGVTVPALAPLSKLQELKEELEEPDKDVPGEAPGGAAES